jgi:NAD(P)-dependent dehydrogenase (short-subunit alcohol dehydrogenase family)
MFMSHQLAPGVRRLALITGASSGIGLELARLFARHNYDLVIAAADPTIDDVATELRLLGAAVETAQVDLATREDVERLASRFRANHRAPDAIALNAAWGHVVALSTGARAWARRRAGDRHAEPLQQMLDEEMSAGSLLNELAEFSATIHAENGDDAQDGEEGDGGQTPRRASKTA